MKKIVLVFGLLSGIVSSGMMLVLVPFAEDIGFEKSTIVGYATMLASGLLIYFGVRSYRDNILGGAIRFGRAFGTGMLIAAVSAVMYAGTWHFVSDRYFPDFMDKYQAHLLESERAKGATQAQLDALVAENKKYGEMYRNPVIKFAFTFVEPMPVALLVSLISAWMLSRRRGAAAAVAAG